MKENSMYSNLWPRMKSLASDVRRHGLSAIGGIFAFSLFFMMGLATLGACLLAGVAAIIMAKWQQHKADKERNTADNTENSESEDPIVAA